MDEAHAETTGSGDGAPQHDARRLLPAGLDEGLSLEKLSDAFASMLARGDDPYGETGAVSAEEQPTSTVAVQDAGDDPCPLTPRSILEAMLFVGHPNNEPLTSQQAAELMRGVRPAEIDELVGELNGQYAALGCPYGIASEGAGYRLVLRDEFRRTRDKLHGRTRQARLSPPAVEVLAVVAYHQPISSEEINRLRGKASGHLLSQLVRRQLLRVERPPENPRRPNYRTTQRFLDLFGLSSLEELPRSEEIDRR